jgi:nucleoside-diphosphate-sugar epimerase
MNILVAGASGLIGSVLVERLVDEKNTIICQSDSFHVEGVGVKWIQHDLIRDTWEHLLLPEFDVVWGVCNWA